MVLGHFLPFFLPFFLVPLSTAASVSCWMICCFSISCSNKNFFHFSFSCLLDVSGFLLHPQLLFLALFLQVKFFQLLVLSTHVFPFSPFSNPFFVVLGFVFPELFLDFSGVVQINLVHGVVEIDNSIVFGEFIVQIVSVVFIQRIVCNVQRD